VNFRPKRLKILWNWPATYGSLVGVFPNTSFERKDRIRAIIAGRSVFASPKISLSPLDFSAKVQKALADDDAGGFFICGCLDYECELQAKVEDVLNEISEILNSTGSYPEYVQRVLQEQADELLRRLGFGGE